MYSFVIGLALIVAAPAPKEAKKDPLTLLGEWALESAIFMGMPLPKMEGPTSVNFSKDGEAIAIEAKGGKPETTKFTHDPKASPARIDFEEKGGMKITGIYKIEGDTLTICMAIMGERPTKFESSATIMLMTLKRIKKD